MVPDLQQVLLSKLILQSPKESYLLSEKSLRPYLRQPPLLPKPLPYSLSFILLWPHWQTCFHHRAFALALLAAWTQTSTKLTHDSVTSLLVFSVRPLPHTLFKTANLSSLPSTCYPFSLFYFSPQPALPLNPLYILLIHCLSFPNRMSTPRGHSETAPSQSLAYRFCFCLITGIWWASSVSQPCRWSERIMN